MKRIYLFIVALFYAGLLQAGEFSVYEANYPGVKDYNVNIDTVRLVIRPQGNFVEINLYMTVSYDFESWFFKNYNELEFLWKFSLPERAVMHDFWFWQGDTATQATIMDKWSAELLFNEVSTPVRNPGLLVQSPVSWDGQVEYQLRLFPLKRQEKRRFKIQYLMPARPSVGALRVWLPIEPLVPRNSVGIDSLNLVYYYRDNPEAPQFVGTRVLRQLHDPAAKAWFFTLPLLRDEFVEMVMPSPIKNQFFFSTYEKGGESFYHLAVIPPKFPVSHRPRKLLFLIDFNRYNTRGLDGEFLLSHLKEVIQQAFSASDSINIFIAYDDIVRGADHWMAATPQGVDTLFTRVLKRNFPSYSSFQPLMAEAANFINAQSDSSEVILFSNTDEISLGYTNRDKLADQVIQMFKPGTRLHFVDLENKSFLRYNSQTGFYETQLQSFYGKMSEATGGNLYFLRYHSIKTILSAVAYDQISHFENVEVQMRFQNGFTHSKHLMALHEGYYPLDFPIMQVGKFVGTPPIEVTVLGKYRQSKVESHFTIEESDVVPGSEQIVTSWYGDHIRSLLRFPQTPVTINDIIDLSIEQRILTPYTGFLIYIINENHGFCASCDDETIVTAIRNARTQKDSSDALRVFPNPFNHAVFLQFKLPEARDITLDIYNALGQRVRRFDLNGRPAGTVQRIRWDARNESGSTVSTGLYFAVLRGSGFRRSAKLLFVK
ncbi:MAG: T9SS C-terminal target domain-containing protein [Calditrichaeota bacterium]|nr:MAG: T9SS C-terminal target domain-containing protein [Calditrichota bacterium]